MISESGIYRVTVNESNNPTYLRTGVYHVEVFGANRNREANFRGAREHNVLAKNDPRRLWSGQAGTYERLVMLEVFERQARVICNRVESDELDAIANSIFGVETFGELSDVQQMEVCCSGV